MSEITMLSLANQIENLKIEMNKLRQRQLKSGEIYHMVNADMVEELLKGNESINRRIDALQLEVREGYEFNNRRIDKLQSQMREGYESTNRRIDKLQSQMREGYESTNRRIDKLQSQMQEGFSELKSLILDQK